MDNVDPVLGTFTNGATTRPMTPEELKGLFSQIPEPQGIVLLPTGGSTFTIYKFNADLLKAALMLIVGRSTLYQPTPIVCPDCLGQRDPVSGDIVHSPECVNT